MNNEFARLFGVAVSSAVLASLLTSSIMVMIVPEPAPSTPQVSTNNSALDQLKAQVEDLVSRTSPGKGLAVKTTVLTSDLAEKYLDKEMSADYVANAVTNKNGYTSFTPYGQVYTRSLSFSNANLGKYTDYLTHPWDTSRFNVWFAPDTSYTGVPDGGFGLVITSEYTKGVVPATCEGDYSDTVKEVASLFVQKFWSAKRLDTEPPTNPCQYVEVSEPLLADNSYPSWGIVDTPKASYVRAYTFTYTDLPSYSSPNSAWPSTTGGEPMLPTIFRRDPDLLPNGGEFDGYTMAVWLKRWCYTQIGGRECVEADKDEEAKLVEATIKKLSSDLTSRTILQTNCFYGECY